VLGVDHFGASAPCNVIAEKFGFTPENVVKIAKEMVQS
jgi:transketolase